MEIARRVMTLLLLAMGIAALAMACVYLPRMAGQAPIREAGFTAAELVTIVLTAVTVILAVLAIVLALFAVWGYVEIKNAAIARAEDVALRTAREVNARLAPDTAGDAFAQAAVKGGPDVDNAG